MARYDVVVAGAGPAGAAAATHLARAGARVVLCDRSAFPRDKACGGGLTPRGVAALERTGVPTDAAFFCRVAGLEMRGAGRRVASPFPATRSWPTFGLVARRRDLDAALLEQAIASGAEFRSGVRVLGPLMEDGVCRGVRIVTSTGREDLEATHTIAADGATSSLARSAGLGHAPGSGRGFWYAALRGYFTPVAPRTIGGAAALEFYPLRTAGGRWLPAYGWVFPLPDGSANVGVDIPHRPRLPGCPDLREAYAGFVRYLRRVRPGFEEACEETPPVGALLPEAMHAFRPGAPGLLAVGDAAGLITPYSGEGIVYALESAELAAGAVTGSERPSRVLDRYGRDLWEGYGFQFRSALAFMKAMRRAPLARAAAAVGMRNERVFRAALRIMAYLIDDGPSSPSTVSRAYRRAEALVRVRPSALWG